MANRKKTNEEYLKELKEKNNGIIPLDKYITGDTEILHKCHCGNKWMAKPRKVLEIQFGCKECKRKRRRTTDEEYLKKLKDLNIKIVPLEPYITNYKKIWHKCECGDKWLVTPKDVLSGGRCIKHKARFVGDDKHSHKTFLQMLKDKGITDVVPLEEYKGYDHQILFRCSCGEKWKAYAGNVLRGHKCGCITGLNQRKSDDQYLFDLKNRNINIIPLENYIKNNTKILHLCICGNKWMVTPADVLNGKKCGCGSKEFGLTLVKTNDEYLQELKSKGSKVEPLEKYQGAKISILHKCECGRKWKTPPSSVLNGNKCGCEVSKGENIIAEYFQKQNISYDRQFTFKDLRVIKPLKFDFVVFNQENIVCFVEFQGILHYKFTPHRHKDFIEFLDAQHRDQLKRDYAKKKSIPLIEVPYYEKTIDYLENELKKLNII